MIVLRDGVVVPAPTLSASLTVYLTDAEKATIKRDAATAGVSMSAWARGRLTT